MAAPAVSASPLKHEAGTARRTDIEVLRGVAICAVLLFHAGVLPAGHLGIDIFFVIAGFVMTRLVIGERDSGTFRPGRFCRRRVARILPAALVTIAVTAALAPFLLPPAAYGPFRADLLGALTFTSNFVAWLRAGEFASAAAAGPLQHMWVLAVEEQFVVLWLLVLLILPRRLMVPAVLLGSLASLAVAYGLHQGLANLPMSHRQMEAAAEFLLPARGFAFLFGAGAALAVARAGPLRLPRALAAVAVMSLLFLLVGGGAMPAPWPSLAASLLVALLCASAGRWLPDGAAIRGSARLGNWSYSIYLVHWPLLAYADTPFAGETPLWLRLMVIAVAVPLGALQWRLVEAPLRRGWRLPPVTLGLRLAGATAGCALFGLAVISPLEESYPQRTSPALGLAEVCEQRGSRFVDHDACRTRARPRVALLGDSHAARWAAPLAAQEASFGGLIQITRSGCTAGRPPAAKADTTGTPAIDCAAFMADAAAWIAATAHIEVVVLSASWSRVPGLAMPPRAFDAGEGAMRIAADIADLVETLRRADKRILLLAPAPPAADGDHANCPRPSAGGPSLGTPMTDGCVFTLSKAARAEASTTAGPSPPPRPYRGGPRAPARRQPAAPSPAASGSAEKAIVTGRAVRSE